MISKEAWQQRIDRISGLFSSMSDHAKHQATWRCPYKNRNDQCTAKFGCRNQRRSGRADGTLMCGGDDKLDYRSFWESEVDASGVAD